MASPDTDLDPDRRTEIAQQAFTTQFDDLYWLHNLSQVSRFNTDACDDLLDTAEQLREDAALLETVHDRIDRGELLPAEGALLIAEQSNFGDYKTQEELYETIPIGGDSNE